MFTIGLPALLSASVQNILFLVLGQSGGDSAELVPSVPPPAPLLALGARPEESHPTALGRGLGMWWEGDGGDMPLRGRDSLGPALAELRFSNFWRLLRVLTLILEHRNAGKDNCKIKFRYFFFSKKTRQLYRALCMELSVLVAKSRSCALGHPAWALTSGSCVPRAKRIVWA